MLSKFFPLRIITYFVVFFTMINSFVFLGLGAYLSVTGIIGIFEEGIHSEAHPGLKILESLDIFLVGLVFLIFAIGIAQLFHPKADDEMESFLPKWLDFENFGEVKLVLWEAILTTLVVLFVSDVVKREGKFDWLMMFIPAAILVLSVSLFIIRRTEGRNEPENANNQS